MTETKETKTADDQVSLLRGLIEPHRHLRMLGRESELEGGTAFTTEGPYYIPLDEHLTRKDIKEDVDGVPLTLQIKIVDAADGEPIPGAQVEIWHCDAFGYYSGHLDEDPDNSLPTQHIPPKDDSRWLRGGQFADDQGIVEFETIYPGWYYTRAVHIHDKITVDGNEVLTSHIFLPDDCNETISKLPPYNQHETLEQVPNEMDVVHEESHGDGHTASTAPIDPDAPEKGFRAELTIAVVPGEKDLSWLKLGRS